jgi:hypothetical protein
VRCGLFAPRPSTRASTAGEGEDLAVYPAWGGYKDAVIQPPRAAAIQPPRAAAIRSPRAVAIQGAAGDGLATAEVAARAAGPSSGGSVVAVGRALRGRSPPAGWPELPRLLRVAFLRAAVGAAVPAADQLVLLI